MNQSGFSRETEPTGYACVYVCVYKHIYACIETDFKKLAYTFEGTGNSKISRTAQVLPLWIFTGSEAQPHWVITFI